MSRRNNEADILQGAINNKQGDSCTKKQDFRKSILELQKTNKLMFDKIKLHDQTTQIQFRLLQKELEESKADAEKRYFLIISTLQKLSPEFKTLFSVEEILPRPSLQNEGRKSVEFDNTENSRLLGQQEQQQTHHYQEHIQHPNSCDNHHQQQQQNYHQQQQPLLSFELHDNNEDNLKALFDERDKKINQDMRELERLLKVMKEEVDELKKREHRRVSFLLQTEDSNSDDEEGGFSKKRSIGSSSYRREDEPDDIIERVKEEELEHHFLPSDTYSYFAVADYFIGGRYCFCPAPGFSLASFVLVIQLVTLSIFIMDVVDYKNKANPISVPPGVSIQVRISQLIALLISCWNQDEVRASFNVLSLGYSKEKVRAINSNATRYKWHFSIFTRMILGWFSLIVTFILIINSDTVRDVMLDFAAVTFVSELDNGAFQLALWGYLGKELQQFTMKIQNIPVYKQKSSSLQGTSNKKVPRLVYLFLVIFLVIGFWIWVTKKQERGGYLPQAVFVQFGDDFSPAMASFSGIYGIQLDNTIDGMRVNYVEKGKRSADGRFSYCSQDKRWIFQYGSKPDDHDDEHLFSHCWHKARSSKTEDYDLTKTSSISWFVKDEDLPTLENPLQHFWVKGQNSYYGKYCGSDDECGERMNCDESKEICVCDDGLFGLNCEFQKPCQILEIDSRDLNGFFGTRSWSRRYSSLSQDIGDDNDNSTAPIQVYGKPVYVGDESIEGIIDVMVFTGRRWILTDSISFKDYMNYNETSSISSLGANNDNNNNKAKRDLAEYLANHFHAYWSNYTFYFVSEIVDVGTPTDSATPVGLRWFRLDTIGTQGASLRSGEQIWKGLMSIKAKLLCAVCHNETNPCFYGATCQADGTCDCTTGSSGRICQIPPDHNGHCDPFFNTPEFGFDGGDCCQETCTSTEMYTCGKGLLENSAGVSAYGFIGYPNCQDPRFKSKLSDSTTLYEIVENRGSVRCGSGVDAGFVEIAEDGTLSGFEVDLCKSIAAAALGDPEAIEIVETNWGNRWSDLTEGKFDVLLFRTTHTAERDVFQSTSQTGFSFARIPEFFDGLRYAGIPPYADCADNLDFESAECVNLKICVLGGTTWSDVTERLFPDSMIVAVDTIEAEVQGLEAGLCNVIAGETLFIAEPAVREQGFTGSFYTLGSNTYSKEPLSAATRQDDRIWSKFVSWIFEALIEAEESGVTQVTANLLAPTDVFGERFENMFQNAVAAAGNFGEIYERNLEYKIPRDGLNDINTGASGLIYSFPFGAIDTVGDEPIVGGTMENIQKRGVLYCGVTKQPGFAMLDAEAGTWRGFEVDLCRGIAAALFNGSPNVNFIHVTDSERFMALADGTIDIMNCAATRTLAREVKEVTTGQGFDFTPPIFYDGLGFAGRPPYVGCAEVRIFDANQDDCMNTRICVPNATTWLDTLVGSLKIPAENIIIGTNQEDTYSKFVLGNCNVLAGETSYIMESTLREFGLAEDEEYQVGSFKYSKEPLAIVSRSDDAQFSDFLRWTVFAFFYAEEQKITRDDYLDMPSNNYLFGRALSNMWQHAIEAVGNYGEIYARNFEGILERGGPNKLNNANGPQFLAMPGIMINR